MKYAQVKKHPDLVKDLESKAVLVKGSNSRAELMKHFQNKKIYINNTNRINKLEAQLEEVMDLLKGFVEKEEIDIG